MKTEVNRRACPSKKKKKTGAKMWETVDEIT
jgi:hypothetical protein